MTVTSAPAPLFERIGGRAGLERIVPDILAFHLANPVVGERFRNARKSIDELTVLAVDFLEAGLSGADVYRGLSMPDAHTGMQITAEEYVAVLDDILAALEKNGVGPQEQAELLYIAYGLKGQILTR